MNMEKLKKDKRVYLIIALSVGLLIVMFSGMLSPGKEESCEKVSKSIAPDSGAMEKRLKDIVETVHGVSDVTVFVNYDNMGEKKITTTTEESISRDGEKQNSSTKSEVVISKGSFGEEPFVSEEKLPAVRGIIICAKGVGSEEIKLIISDAVSGALGVPIHRVKVLCKD